MGLIVDVFAAGTVATGLMGSVLGAHASPAALDDVMQAIADATVIDAECRTTNTMYGTVFRYGDEHGVARNDILLSGKRRKAFENAMQWRRATTPPEEICGALQARYRAAFPDWFRSR